MLKAMKDQNPFDPVTGATVRWPEGAIVYQIYPRSFFDSNDDGIGDIAGITEKLDYLKDLGVNALWLSPFYPSPMADFGYDIADYRDVDPIFGKLSDMDVLLAEARMRDIKIMVDLVPNHTSDEHEWFRQSRQSQEDPYSDWYVWRDPKGHDKKGQPIPPNNWASMLDGEPTWEWEPARQQFYLHTFDIKQPDLNWANPEVREAIKDVMRYWLDKGVDGFRVDAVPFIAKDPLLRDDPVNPHYKKGRDPGYAARTHTYSSGWPQMYAYLAELAAVLKEDKYVHSHRFMVTEAYPETANPIEEYLEFYEGMDPEVAAPFIFEGMWLEWSAKAWRTFLTELHMAMDDFSPLCIPSYAFGNHDQPRIASRFGEAKARAAAVLLLTLPGMAFIYNGDELGMIDGNIPPEMVMDPAAGQGGPGRDPERTPLHWSAGPNAGFSRAKTTWLPLADNYKTHNVETELQDPNSFLTLYRRLGELRNTSSALRTGAVELVDTTSTNVLGLLRRSDSDAYVTFINFSAKSANFSVKASITPGSFVLSSESGTKRRAFRQGKLSLRPHEAVIFKVRS